MRFLERRADPTDPSNVDRSLQWGYVYCVGLLVGAVVESLVSGQLWFVSNSMLSTGIRVQLNTLIFDKTLRRKDISAPSSSNSSPSSNDSNDDEGEGDEGDDEDAKDGGGFKTKSSLTNLFAIDSERCVSAHTDGGFSSPRRGADCRTPGKWIAESPTLRHGLSRCTSCLSLAPAALVSPARVAFEAARGVSEQAAMELADRTSLSCTAGTPPSRS